MAPVTDLELEILVFIEQLGSTGTIEESRIWKDSSSNLGPQSTYDNLKKKNNTQRHSGRTNMQRAVSKTY